MSRYNAHDPFGGRTPPNAGFRVGLVAGLMMVGVHLAFLLMFGGTNRGDLPGWIIGWFVYLLAARTAAQKQYSAQQQTMEPLRNVKGAGVGAALITCAIVWIYIIVRGVFRDALGIIILVEPISLYCMMVIDGLIALGLGSWGGRSVARKYESFQGW